MSNAISGLAISTPLTAGLILLVILLC